MLKEDGAAGTKKRRRDNLSTLLAPLLAYTGFFTLLHVVFLYGISPDYHRAFKLSRAIPAAIMTLMGLAAVFPGIQHWQVAFLYRHDPSASFPDLLMWHGMLVVMGHLLSDFLWMFYGRATRAIIPRRDLLIHHGVCLAAFSYALWKEVGFALCLIALVSELMPVTTGISGWGQHIGRKDVMEVANRIRLAVLIWWRRPLWFLLAALTARTILAQDVQEGFGLAFAIAAVGFTTLIFLDKYWIAKCSA
jgi:hypothetical protein